MAKRFSEAEGEALNTAVRGIVEQAIASLQAVGMTDQGALALLVTQAAIRIEEATEVRRLLKSIEGMYWIDDEGGLSLE